MPEYRLYHFNFEGAHIHRAETLTAADDVDAVTEAESRVDGKRAELWRGARKVKTFDP